MPTKYLLSRQLGSNRYTKSEVTSLAHLADDNSLTNPNRGQIQWSLATSVPVNGNQYQFFSFWDENRKMVISFRNRTTESSWTSYTYDGSGGRPDIEVDVDNHNTVVLDIDISGYLHVSYNHHNDPLNYRRSTVTVDSFEGVLTAETGMFGGSGEGTVSYPQFIRDNNDQLRFIHRGSIGSGNADTYLYKYDAATTTWSAFNGLGSDGKLYDGRSTNTDNLYHGRIVFDNNNVLWLSGHIRKLGGSDTDHDVLVVKYDGSWKQADGTSQTIPIESHNADYAYQNRNSSPNPFFDHGFAHKMDLDSSGNPHIIFFADSRDVFRNSGPSAAFNTYVRHDGTNWVGLRCLYQNTGNEIYIDRDTDTVYLINPTTYAKAQTPFTDWEIGKGIKQTIVASPFITDPYQWRDHKRFEWAPLYLTGRSPDTTPDYDPYHNWWDSSWTKRTKITIQASQVTANLKNLPIYVDLSNFRSDHEIWSLANSDGSDIRVTQIDGCSQLSIDLVSFDPVNKTGELHFNNYGTLSSTTNTSFYIYYGNPGASALTTSDRGGNIGVFDEYTLVKHLADYNSVVGAYGLSGTANGTLSNTTTGKLGPSSAQRFDVSNGDYISHTQVAWERAVVDGGIGDPLVFSNANGWCGEALVKMTQADLDGASSRIMFKGRTNTNYWYWQLSFNTTNNYFTFGIFRTGGLQLDVSSDNDSIVADTWVHVAFEVEGTSIRIFVNGVLQNTSTDAALADSETGGYELLIGGRTNGTNPTEAYFNGELDEVRLIRDQVKGADWWTTQSNMLLNNSSFITLEHVVRPKTRVRLASGGGSILGSSSGGPGSRIISKR